MILLLFLLYLVNVAAAGDIPTLYAPPKYQPAMAKAQEAFLVQTGVQGQINYVKDTAGKVGIYVVKQLGIEKPLAAGLWCAKVVRERSVSFPVGKQHVTIAQDHLEVKIPF